MATDGSENELPFLFNEGHAVMRQAEGQKRIELVIGRDLISVSARREML